MKTLGKILRVIADALDPPREDGDPPLPGEERKLGVVLKPQDVKMPQPPEPVATLPVWGWGQYL